MNITEDKTLVLEYTNAVKLVKSLKGRVRFQVNISAFLPTEGNMGFNGWSSILISRTKFLEVLEGYQFLCENRGAKISLKLYAPSYGSEL